MPRSRSVVESTRTFGPASVRIVSLRAGMPSTRILQSMLRRAMRQKVTGGRHEDKGRPLVHPSRRAEKASGSGCRTERSGVRRRRSRRALGSLAADAVEAAALLGAQLCAADPAFLRSTGAPAQPEVPMNLAASNA